MKKETHQASADGLANNRCIPFWAWNTRLNEANLLAQIESMKAHGAGGFFIHSREGLETEYLSDEWLALARACAEKAAETGMRPLLYDEDKWPSGMAGGLVTKAEPKYAAKAYVYTEETDQVCIRQSLGHPWYSGNPPADNLSEGSVAKFIELTHERYLAAFGGSLEGKIEGVFTDEPNFWDFFFNLGDENRPALPYTDDLPDEFERRRGYRLDPRLLFFKEQGYRQHRHDYWRTLAELFCERYTKQIFEWCGTHGIKLTGHYLFENQLGYQARVCGAVMPNFEYMDIPGIDILGEQTREYVAAKQCASVAHQYGKKATISETYGCSGWEFTFEGQKRVWDWQCVLGITLRSPHFWPCTIKGLRKRDYPPFFGPQEWFTYNKVMEDYCARLSVIMSEGAPMRDVLVLHTISSTWCECGSSRDEDLTEFDDNMGWTCPTIYDLNAEGDSLNLLAESLMKAGLDFDFGDEILMVKDGGVEAPGEGDTRFRIKHASYGTVIVPAGCRSIFRTTYGLLREFAAAGGRLIVAGDGPAMIEGEAAEGLREELRLSGAEFVSGDHEAVKLAGESVEAPAEIFDLRTGRRADLISVFRRTGDGVTLVAVNEDMPRSCEVRISGFSSICEVDLMTGEEKPFDTGASGEFYVDFLRSDCRVYRLTNEAKAAGVRKDTDTTVRPVYHDPHRTEEVVWAFPPKAAFRRTMPNALILDRCRYRLNGSAWSEDMQVWEAQREIREALGFRQIYGNGVDMRYTWIYDEKPTAHVELSFGFDVCEAPSGDTFACIEEAWRYRVAVNGEEVEVPPQDAVPAEAVSDGADAEYYFLDPAFRKVRIGTLAEGRNIVTVSCEYSHEMELEDIYLLGDFGVNPSREIVREPEKLQIGDATLQGYFHYPGSLVYSYGFESTEDRGLLDVGDFRATLIVVRVNGAFAGYIINGNKVRLDLKVGRNTIEFEVVGSNRNLLGPFHRKYEGSSRVSWLDFRTEGDACTSDYFVKPFGLLSQIKIVKVK